MHEQICDDVGLGELSGFQDEMETVAMDETVSSDRARTEQMESVWSKTCSGEGCFMHKIQLRLREDLLLGGLRMGMSACTENPYCDLHLQTQKVVWQSVGTSRWPRYLRFEHHGSMSCVYCRPLHTKFVHLLNAG